MKMADPQSAAATLAESHTRPPGLASRWTVPGICIFLALIVWIVFGQTSRFDFIKYDDDLYVYNDPVVTRGLTLEGVKAAFSDRHSDNWVPLTTLSHMLDCQLYGLNAGGHHFTNVLLQTATAILLFLALREMTGFLWRSAFVAAVFAIHPLRAESVAWISERKDVLSGVFFALTLWAYVRYVRSPRPFGWYLATLFCFILGLLSKPSVVPLPFLLLLLDYWPLQRFNTSAFKRLLLEKIPLLLLSLACCIPTVLSQGTAIQPLKYYPLPLRIENAIVSYVIQMERMFYPANLAVFYPYPNAIPWWEVVLTGTLLAGICAVVWTQRQTRPWLLVGWLWYLAMIAPNIGFIQVGSQAQADRYTYLPQIGLVLALTWTVAGLCAAWRHRRLALAGFSTVVLPALIFCAHTQAAYWRNSETLWNHTLACTSGNFIAYNDLGDALLQKGQVEEAMLNFQQALQINPDFDLACDGLGVALLQKGRVGEAISYFQRALQIKPDNEEACYDLGNAVLQEGKVDKAVALYHQALQIKSDYVEAHNNLGNALLQTGDVERAIVQFQQALQLNPDFAKARVNLGNALLQKGSVDEAVAQFQQALQLNPDLADADYDLGNVSLQKGQVDDAVAFYEQALKIKPDYAEAQNNLGEALLREGKVDDAVLLFGKALAINPNYAVAQFNLGLALSRRGDLAGAITHYQNALEINPGYLEAQVNLGNALRQTGNTKEAMVHYQKAMNLAQAAGRPDIAQRLSAELNSLSTGEK
jgi:protein O-mannosyl-transferase